MGKPETAVSSGRRTRRRVARTSSRLLLSLIPLWVAHVCLAQESPKPAGKAEPIQVLPDKAAPPASNEPAAAAKPAQEAEDGEPSPRRKRGFAAPPGPPIQATPVEGQADLIDVIRPKAMKSGPDSARPPN